MPYGSLEKSKCFIDKYVYILVAAQYGASLFCIYSLLPQLLAREAEFFLEGQSEEPPCFFRKRQTKVWCKQRRE